MHYLFNLLSNQLPIQAMVFDQSNMEPPAGTQFVITHDNKFVVNNTNEFLIAKS